MKPNYATMPLDDRCCGVAAPSGNPLADSLDHPVKTGGTAPLEALVQSLDQHRPTLVSYLTLALQTHLTAADEDRMVTILTQAIDDPLLSFWIDEADCWAGEHRLSEEALKQQQTKLRRRIGQTWVDTLWQDLQNRTKALQVYLNRMGVYSGAVDGVMGPMTQRAVESLKKVYPDDLPLGYL